MNSSTRSTLVIRSGKTWDLTDGLQKASSLVFVRFIVYRTETSWRGWNIHQWYKCQLFWGEIKVVSLAY